MPLSPNYVRQIFNAYAGNPKEFRDGRMLGSCPSCHEGNSFGRKRRLYYYPDTGSLYCFNCQKSWRDIDWCAEVQGKDRKEVFKEAKDYGFFFVSNSHPEPAKPTEGPTDELPEEAINLSSPKQLAYYGDDKYIKLALETIHKRRLDTCVNRLTYYISLKDPVHKNRLIIPFYDESGKIVYYQTRSLDGTEPKYLSKAGSPKTVFGIDKIDTSMDSYFVFEGPLDSCFVQNGVAVCGLNLVPEQESSLEGLFALQRIWVLDNDFRTNKDVIRRYRGLLDAGERVFIWPKAFSKYKDLNDLCIDRKMDSIKPEVFEKYSFTKDEGFDILDRAMRFDY